MKYTSAENYSSFKLAENITLEEFLDNTVPEYKEVVPSHWLHLQRPSRSLQLVVATILLFICLIGNINQLLVFIAFGR